MNIISVQGGSPQGKYHLLIIIKQMASTETKLNSRTQLKYFSMEITDPQQEKVSPSGEWQNCENGVNQAKFATIEVPFQSTDFNSEKVKQTQSKGIEWSLQELDLFAELCIQNGFAWNAIAKKFSNKSQYYLKNYFHSQLRKSTNFLHEFSITHWKQKIKTITPKLVIPIIDLGNQIIKLAQTLGLTINMENILFVFRKNIIEYCLKKKKFSFEYVLQLVKLLKKISFKMRSFGIFKVKNRKLWKLSIQSLRGLCEKDLLILDEGFKKSCWNLSTKSQKRHLNEITPGLTSIGNAQHDEFLEDCLLNDFYISKSDQQNHSNFDDEVEEILGIKKTLVDPVDYLGFKF